MIPDGQGGSGLSHKTHASQPPHLISNDPPPPMPSTAPPPHPASLSPHSDPSSPSQAQQQPSSATRPDSPSLPSRRASVIGRSCLDSWTALEKRKARNLHHSRLPPSTTTTMMMTTRKKSDAVTGRGWRRQGRRSAEEGSRMSGSRGEYVRGGRRAVSRERRGGSESVM